ncbi:hypothetical protein JYG23_12065 [Sedimentibacter sp. zth1]|uniref:hypothetical protein n=1 Tax=Sedimentibacter sp. zth1 TaxID=2816908 RepID=UPI001A91A903|nr:hypothetical protein [Sedimentibacter sp. zth1]QSX05403.1 hypothetical protein JYG23_12065 [Sedimentibacter sp. zth1]
MSECNNTADKLKIDDDNIIREIFSGKLLDIVIELMDNQLSEQQLLKKLDIYPMRLKYYINKLLEYNIIECVKNDIVNQRVNNVFKLRKDDIDLILNSCSEHNLELNLLSGIEKYRNMVKKSFQSVCANPDTANKQAFLIIRVSDEKVKEFKCELNEVIKKYSELEDKSEKNKYLYMTLLSRYDEE